jgi:leader peptidase (prepilin peptidase) / N-methyltransferase
MLSRPPRVRADDLRSARPARFVVNRMFQFLSELNGVIPLWFKGGFAFILGCCIGSFLNVVIYRVPRGGSVASPSRSFCPNCKNSIAGYDNIPVLSFLLLRAKCRNCGLKISWQYPLVELLTGLLFFLAVYRLGVSWELPAALVFISALVALIFTDYNEQILPDAITLPGLALAVLLRCFDYNHIGMDWLGLLFEGATFRRIPETGLAGSLINTVAGAIIGGGSLWLIGVAYFRIRFFRIKTIADLEDFVKNRAPFLNLARLKVQGKNGTRAVFLLGGDLSQMSEAELVEGEFNPPPGGSPELKLTTLSGLTVETTPEGLVVTDAPEGLQIEEGTFEPGDRIISGNIEGMGLGDVKMMLFVGAFLGGGVTFLVLVTASILGGLIAVPKLLTRGWSVMQVPIPFGVMLGIATLLGVFFGEYGLKVYFEYALRSIK